MHYKVEQDASVYSAPEATFTEITPIVPLSQSGFTVGDLTDENGEWDQVNSSL